MSSKYKFANPEGVYLISFATVQWVDIFTRPVYKNLLVESLLYCQKSKGLILYAWCIMSNHVHLIASAKEGHNLSDILRDLKKFTSKKLVEEMDHPSESRKNWMLWIFRAAGKSNSNNLLYQVWQQDNHPIELTDAVIAEQKLDYLHQNPVKEEIVFSAEEYVYSSAIDYAGGKGLIDIQFLE